MDVLIKSMLNEKTNREAYNRSINFIEVMKLNIYLTIGTYEFLKSIRKKYENEQMVLFENEEHALLLHETSGKSLFETPRSFEIFDQSGDIQDRGFAVFNNIPVSDEGKPVFEYRFKNRAGKIEEVPGFIAIRVLRPTNSDTYVVFTLWEDESSFIQWQESKQYAEAHKKRGTAEGIDTQTNIFSGPSYVTKYSVPEEE